MAFATAAPEQAALSADDDNAPPEFNNNIVKYRWLSIVTCAEIAKTIGMANATHAVNTPAAKSQGAKISGTTNE